jgi:hypothetical protein
MPHNMSDESVKRPGAGLKIERIDGEGAYRILRVRRYP